MIGPSDQCPLWGKGGAEGTKGGAFPSAVRPVCMFFSSEARFYGFLNDKVIPQSFRKPYNRPDGRGKTSQPRCAREMHPLCLRHLPQRGRWPEGPNTVMQWRRFYDLKGTHDAEATFEPDDEGTSVFHASSHDEGGVSSFVSFPTHVFLGSIF